MSLNSYLELRAESIERRLRLQEADTQTSREETQEEKEWLLAALTSIAVSAQDALRRGNSRDAVLQELRQEWLDALKKSARAAFRKGARLRAQDSAVDVAKLARESKRLNDQIEFQSGFLFEFADDLVAGDTTKPDKMDFLNRAMLYALSMTGYYNLGAIEAGSQDSLIYWRLGACDHCTDCPALHVSGPYTPKTLPTVPGLGHTRCGHWCCCYLYVVPNVDSNVMPVSLAAGSGAVGLLALPSREKEEVQDARLRDAYLSRLAFDDDDDVYRDRLARSQAELDALLSQVPGYVDEFPLGGPVIGLDANGISISDEMYNDGMDIESLKMISEDDIERFLDDNLVRGAE